MKIFLIFSLGLMSVWNSLHAEEEDQTKFWPGACKVNDEKFNTEEGGCLDFSTGVVWEAQMATSKTFKEAEDICKNITVQGNFKGLRLPTKSEILSISKDKIFRNYIEINAVGNFWTSTSNNFDAFAINIDSSETFKFDKNDSDNKGSVICVRLPRDYDGDRVPDSSDVCPKTSKLSKAQTTGERKGCAEKDETRAVIYKEYICRKESDRFKSADGGCKDLKTGLVWGQYLYNSAYVAEEHESAERSCKSRVVEIDGKTYANWRLPTKEEAVAISGNLVRHFSDSDYFYWTSTRESTPSYVDKKYEFKYFAVVGTARGKVEISSEKSLSAVFCVRESTQMAKAVGTRQETKTPTDKEMQAQREQEIQKNNLRRKQQIQVLQEEMPGIQSSIDKIEVYIKKRRVDLKLAQESLARFSNVARPDYSLVKGAGDDVSAILKDIFEKESRLQDEQLKLKKIQKEIDFLERERLNLTTTD